MRDIDPIDYLSALEDGDPSDAYEHDERPDPGFAADLLDMLHAELADTSPTSARSTPHLRLMDSARDPHETVPVETVPVETVPVETVPVETVPVEIAPDATPIGSQARRRFRVLEVAAVVALVVGSAFFIRTRAQDTDLVSVTSADAADSNVDSFDPTTPSDPQSLVGLLDRTEGFTYITALLEMGTQLGDCSAGGEFTIYAHDDVSIEAFLDANGLDAAALFADPNIVSALLEDIAVEGVIQPPRTQTENDQPADLVSGLPLGEACNGVAFEVGGFWVPSDAATVALLDVGPELASAEAIADAFIVARSEWSGPTVQSLIADDALIRGELGGAAASNTVARSSFERASGTRIVEHDCVASTPQLVRCSYTMESDIGLPHRSEPYKDNLVILTIQAGEIQQVVNSIGNNEIFIQDGEAFRSWLEQTHPSDLTVMMVDDGPLLSDALVLTDEAIALWQLRLPEYVES